MNHPTLAVVPKQDKHRSRLFRSQGNTRQGFALLITITLLAFLVLLLVSLASLTRVETQVATNHQSIFKARQNALLALNIAIGQLQKYAGPDQRTTARSDISAGLANSTTANGRWTGVYGNRVVADYVDTPTQIAAKIETAYLAATDTDAVSQTGSLARKGSQAILLNWLVSGNEAAAFEPLTAVATDGHITLTVAPTQPHTPVSTTNLSTASITPSISDAFALLLGPGSVISVSDRVTAPLVNIQVPQNTLPGMSPADATLTTIGRHAWWVGDEGSKANVNLSIDPATPSLPAANSAYAFVSAQRTAIELMDGVNPVGSTNATDLITTTAYDPTSQKIGQVLSPSQLSMVSASSATTFQTARKLRFHDLTASSCSVLADTCFGGLKKDLSAILAPSSASDFPNDADHIFPPEPGAGAQLDMPRWGALRSFLRQSSGTSTGDALTPQLPTATQVGIHPMITFAEVGLEYYKTATDNIRLALMPRIVLWNPYTRPLASARYEFGMGATQNTAFRLQSSTDGGTTWVNKETAFRSLVRGGFGTSPPGVSLAYLRFVVNVTSPLAPGESRIYVIGSGSGQPYYAQTEAGYSAIPTNILERNDFIPGFVYLETGLTVLPSEIYRVQGDGASGTAIFRGESNAYLGLDPASSSYAETSPDGSIWPGSGRQWYQSINRNSASGTPLYPVLQNGLNGLPGFSPWGLQTRAAFNGAQRFLTSYNPRGFLGARNFNGYAAYTSNQGTGISVNFTPSSDQKQASTDFSNGLDVTVGQNPVDNILFEFRPANQPLLSLGQLQHANLSPRVDWPAYPIGNSVASYLRLDSTQPQLTAGVSRKWLYRKANDTGSNLSHPSAVYAGGLYDASYLLNRALWDRFFFSTIPYAGTGTSADTNTIAIPPSLPNPRHVRTSDATDALLRDYAGAAAHLTLKGGFNINSTSEQAWRAVLGGTHLLSDWSSGTPDAPTDAAFSRFSAPPNALPIVNGQHHWASTGYRRLTTAQVSALASNIVREIRNRGPFVSLADFVNRRLRDNPDTTQATAASSTGNESALGALQSAIDSTPQNGTTSINNARNTRPFNIANQQRGINATLDLDDEAIRGQFNSAGSAAAIPPFDVNAAYSAQFLTQADVLSVIGAGLSARSDTFTVRTYGDVVNPITNEISARAWCEAVVQRTVEPVNRKNATPTTTDYYEPSVATATQPDFGRRFKIISFRWLSSLDI